MAQVEDFFIQEINNISFEAIILGDLDSSGEVGRGDVGMLTFNFGVRTGANISMGDLNGDGAVNVLDLLILSSLKGDRNPRGSLQNIRDQLHIFLIHHAVLVHID